MTFQCSNLRPLVSCALQGTFENGERYQVSLDESNLYNSLVEVSYGNDNDDLVPVTWEFPLLNKKKLLHLLHTAPEKFQVTKKKTEDAFQIIVTTYDPEFNQEKERFINILNAENIAHNPRRLSNISMWLYSDPDNKPERRKMLEDFIASAKDNVELEVAVRNAQAMLAQ